MLVDEVEQLAVGLFAGCWVTGTWTNGIPWWATVASRSGWFDTTTGTSSASSPACTRYSRSTRQWS